MTDKALKEHQLNKLYSKHNKGEKSITYKAKLEYSETWGKVLANSYSPQGGTRRDLVFKVLFHYLNSPKQHKLMQDMILSHSANTYETNSQKTVVSQLS